MSGTTSSSWNWIPSNPRSRQALSFSSKGNGSRTGGPNGSLPSWMFQGPNENRYFRAIVVSLTSTPGVDRAASLCLGSFALGGCRLVEASWHETGSGRNGQGGLGASGRSGAGTQTETGTRTGTEAAAEAEAEAKTGCKSRGRQKQRRRRIRARGRAQTAPETLTRSFPGRFPRQGTCPSGARG